MSCQVDFLDTHGGSGKFSVGFLWLFVSQLEMELFMKMLAMDLLKIVEAKF